MLIYSYNEDSSKLLTDVSRPPRTTTMMQQKTVKRNSMSAILILSPSKKYASTHTRIGDRLKTMPTVEMLKYLIDWKENIYREAPEIHLIIKVQMYSLSMSSIN